MRNPLYAILMRQEFNYWTGKGEQVSIDEFEWLCKRRGFTYDESLTLMEWIINFGLGEELRHAIWL